MFAGSLRSQRFVCTLVFATFRGVEMAQRNVRGCRVSNFPDDFESSERWRSQCASRRSPVVCSPSCALARFDAIDARQVLCQHFPMSIVASWHVMRVRIFGSGLVDRAAAESGSIRGRNRSSPYSHGLIVPGMDCGNRGRTTSSIHSSSYRGMQLWVPARLTLK